MRLYKRAIFTFLFSAVTFSSFSQKSGPIIFTVDSDTVWGGEFERVYSKNNQVESQKPTAEEIQEYLDLYVRFKLKVKEAYSLKMDTSRAYLTELAGYRRTLAQPYLTDKKVTDELINEAYERKKYEVNASNLMIHLSPVASPEDTLKAYNRIKVWRDMIVSGKVSFADMARDSSTDQSAKTNNGELGYFTVFSMIYPFENMAYNTPVNGVSPIFRTQYGYHILRVNDKRPNRGERKVAHIMIRVNNESEIEEKKAQIDAVYKELKEGTSWDELVDRYTQDFSTRTRGGEMNWFGSITSTDGIPATFREAAFALKKIGEYSQPVLTEAGWHIIKLNEEREMLSLDEMRETLKYRISKDQRGEINKAAVLKRVKEENNYTPFESSINKFMESLDSDVKNKAWKATPFHETDEVLFTIANKKYTYAEFAKYLFIHQPFRGQGKPAEVGMSVFEKYVDEMNMDYEESVLEDKYPKFRYLMQEYRDGILLFELTSKMVWEKATEDTTGLRAFFESNRDNYRWDQRADITIYSCKDEKTKKKVNKLLNSGKSDEDISKKINARNPLKVQISMKRIERGVDTVYNAIEWSEGIYPFDDGSKNSLLVKVTNVIEPGLKELNEVKGPVTSDYQEYLEDKWITELKGKYKVEMNEQGLDQLFSSK